ncbi:MAG: CHAD domain-containing protein, partial [Thermoplasmata archaeon]|nr:CHAD domain-containing protein [Thermoplasmata archaeon]
MSREISGHGPRWNPPVEELHDLHRSLRRLRVELRPWRQAVRGARHKVIRESDRELREVSRLVGQIRDRDVAQTVLDRLARRHALLELEGLPRIQRALANQARAGRRLLPAAVGVLQSSGALEAIETVALAELSPVESLRWSTFVRKSEEEVLSELRKRFERARRGRSAERLHELRQALRSAHLWADSFTLPTVPWFPETLAELQSELGSLQDLWITLDLLRNLPPGARARAWLGPIHARFEARSRA